MKSPNRFNVLLDDEHAARLNSLAARVHLSPGTLAKSLLSSALDQSDPDAASVTALLDAIPGAHDRAEEGLREVRMGRGVPLEDL